MKRCFLILIIFGLNFPVQAKDQVAGYIRENPSVEKYDQDIYLAMHYYKLKNFKQALGQLKKFNKDAAAGNPRPSDKASYFYILYRVSMHQAKEAEEQGRKVLYLECKDRARDFLDRVQVISDNNDAHVNQMLGPGHEGAVMNVVANIKQFLDCYDSNSGDCKDPITHVAVIPTPTPESVPVTVFIKLSKVATPVIKMGYYENENPPGVQVTMNWNPILEGLNTATTVIYLPKGSGRLFWIEEEYPKDKDASFELVVSQPGSKPVTSQGTDCSGSLGCRRGGLQVIAGKEIRDRFDTENSSP